MRIEQLARVTGVSVQAIRHYAAVGLLPPVEEGSAGYSEAHIHAIKLVKMAQSIGMSLREIMSVLAANADAGEAPRLNRALMLLNKYRHHIAATDNAEQMRTLEALQREIQSILPRSH